MGKSKDQSGSQGRRFSYFWNLRHCQPITILSEEIHWCFTVLQRLFIPVQRDQIRQRWTSAVNSYSFKKKSIMESACNLNGSVSVLCGSSVRHGPQSASYSSLITSPSLSCMSIQPVLFPTKFLGFVDFFFLCSFLLVHYQPLLGPGCDKGRYTSWLVQVRSPIATHKTRGKPVGL